MDRRTGDTTLSRALGAFTREIARTPAGPAEQRLQDEFGLDEKAARNLVAYLREQEESTGTLPSHRDITVERFRDELGDWRVCTLTPFGARVHAPRALAIRSAVSERVGYDVQTVWSDDGIVLTIADGDEPPDVSTLIPDAQEMDDRPTLPRWWDASPDLGHWRQSPSLVTQRTGDLLPDPRPARHGRVVQAGGRIVRRRRAATVGAGPHRRNRRAAGVRRRSRRRTHRRVGARHRIRRPSATRTDP